MVALSLSLGFRRIGRTSIEDRVCNVTKFGRRRSVTRTGAGVGVPVPIVVGLGGVGCPSGRPVGGKLFSRYAAGR